MKSFKQYVNEQKELTKATQAEWLEFSKDKKLTVLAFPATDLMTTANLETMLGEPEKLEALGTIAWYYKYKDSIVEYMHNTKLERTQARGLTTDSQLLIDFRTKMIQAYDKKFPGLVEQIRSSWKKIPGQKQFPPKDKE